ncbi:MAG TPA: hypothetical protein VFI03_12370 [Solirubrobacterales bacterium]|nr:hypothetical protein [Solirubrobacterales bacterium]
MLPFWLSIGALSLVQAALVAAPRPAIAPFLAGLRNSSWALVLPLSIVVVVSAIALEEAVADFLTYLALFAVPPLAALALAAIVRGGRPPLALLTVPLFAIAWAGRDSLSGETAALILSALACVSLGWLLVCVVPGLWVKIGVCAMAIIDAWLVGSDLLQGPNAVLNAAAPGGLPQLQFVSFGSAVMGFGDIFIAAVLGALLASDRRLQLTGAALAAVFCLSFDFLFFALDTLPATVPIALTLVALELRIPDRVRAGSRGRRSQRSQLRKTRSRQR